MNHDREGEHHPLAQPAAGGEAAPPLGGDPAEGGAEHGLRGGTGDGGEDSRGTRPERATRFVETTQGGLPRVGASLQPFALFPKAVGLLAEGRFLTIHPFRDFNGRTIRLFLSELLRRLDLPEVDLAPESDEDRQRYFSALEAADERDWQPLMAVWNARLTTSEQD